MPTSDALATMKMLTKGTLVSVPGGSHAPMSTDDYTLGIANRFFDDLGRVLDTSCMASRAENTGQGRLSQLSVRMSAPGRKPTLR